MTAFRVVQTCAFMVRLVLLLWWARFMLIPEPALPTWAAWATIWMLLWDSGVAVAYLLKPEPPNTPPL